MRGRERLLEKLLAGDPRKFSAERMEETTFLTAEVSLEIDYYGFRWQGMQDSRLSH